MHALSELEKEEIKDHIQWAELGENNTEKNRKGLSSIESNVIKGAIDMKQCWAEITDIHQLYCLSID